MMIKRNLDASLIPFLSSIIGIIFKAALFISVAGMIGIEMTSFVAILGAAGLAVGLALQGTLQNFAGGVMLLLFRIIIGSALPQVVSAFPPYTLSCERISRSVIKLRLSLDLEVKHNDFGLM